MLYELLLGVLTATLVPQFVRHVEREDDEAISAIMTIAIAVLVVVSVVGVLLAPYIVQVFTLRAEGASRAAQQEVATTLVRLFMPQIVFYGFTARDCAAERAPPIRGGCVRADAQQHRGHLDLCLIAPLARRADHARPRPRRPALLITLGVGTTAGIAAVARARRCCDGPGSGSGSCSRRHRAVVAMARLSSWTLGYVMANQIALDRARPGQRPRRRAVHLPQRVCVLPAPHRAAGGLAHDDARSRDGERGGSRRHQGAARTAVLRAPRRPS